MRRFFLGVSALFVLAVYVGFLIPSTIVSDKAALQSSGSYTTYSYLNSNTAPLLSATNEVVANTVAPTLSIDDSVDARLVGMLLHLKWLIAKNNSTGGVDRTLFDKQVQSLLDDINDDEGGDNLEEVLDGGEFDNPTLNSPVFSGPIGSNMAIGPYYISGDGGDEGITIDAAGNVQLTAALRDTSGDSGSNGYILLSTGSGTNWVATSSLGFAASISNDAVTPDNLLSSGQTDEYCLTYEATGDTWEWQTCGSSGSGFATSSIDTSLKLATIVTNETGSGNLVFSASPTLTGTLTTDAVTLSSTLTLSGSAANIALGSNYLSGDGGDEGIFIDSDGDIGLTTNNLQSNAQVTIRETSTINTGGQVLVYAETSVDPSAASDAFYGAAEFYTNTQSGNAQNMSAAALVSAWIESKHYGTNNIGYVVGSSNGAQNRSSGSITDAVGTETYTSNNSTGSINEATSLRASFGNTNTSGLVTTQKSISIDFFSNAGTITNTYGLYIGDITAGTQTNTPYSIYASDAGTRNYFAGTVGIGTTTPNQLLTVQGNINLSSVVGAIYFDDTKYLYASSTNDSLVFGENAGATFNSGTTNNIAIGLNAGRHASTTDDSIYIGSGAGTNNTGWDSHLFGVDAGANNSGYSTNAMGYEAGYNNTNSDNNFFGYNAGYNNVGESGNFFGNSAGYNNTGLYNNNIFGYGAGYNNAGDENNIFGQNAGYNNTGGYTNLFGENAGRNNLGSYNSFIGGSAGYSNTGNFNDFIGYQAGRYLRSTSTVAIGTEALYGGSTYESLNNVAIGYRAGYASQAGSGNNILLGYRVADNLTTGNNNVVIGYDIDNITATADNRLNIGNLIFGTGLDGTGTTLASGNVGIGTTTPWKKLSVAGDISLTGSLYDSLASAGTSGMVLQTTGGATRWVATSTLGITGGPSLLTDGGANTYLTATGDNFSIGGSGGSARLNVYGDIDVAANNAGLAFTGTRYIYASTTNDSITFGEFAGSSLTSATTFNVALGYEAGRSMSNTNADYMLMLGYQAGYSNTGDHTNIIGFGSGFSNSGDYTNIIGQSAGLANSGDYSNLIGAFAGRNNTGGFNNFIGHSVGFSNTGNYNNFIGYYTGYNNTGNNNDFIGYQAGRYLLSSTSVAIGAEALYGSHATTYFASNNVAIGYQAGYAADDGASNNILIGYQAADNLTTGNNNIIIGHNIDSISATADNVLNIGNLIFGTGLIGTGTTLSGGNIGIGTTTPSQKLVVAGSVQVTGTLAGVSADFSSDIFLANSAYINSLGYARMEEGIAGAPAFSFENDTNTGIYNPNTDTLAFSTAGSERARFTAAGNMGIGTTTPAQKLQVFGNIRVGTAGANGCLEDFGGGVIAGTCSSDENLKENIEPIAQEGRTYLESLVALTPVTYNWNEVAGELYSKNTTVENLGLIAQDVETQFPELVSQNDDGYKQVDFRALPFYIIEALKELWIKVQGQDERLEQLEQENDYLKERIETIEDELNIEAPPEIVVEEDVVSTEELPEEVPTTDILEEVVEPEPVVEELVEEPEKEPTYVLVPAESL